MFNANKSTSLTSAPPASRFRGFVVGLITAFLFSFPLVGCRDEPRHRLGAKPTESAKEIEATRKKLGDIRERLEGGKPLGDTDRRRLAAAVHEDDFVNAVLALLLTSIAHEAGQFSLEEAKDLHIYRLAREQGVRALIVGRGAESLLIEGRHRGCCSLRVP